VRSLPHSSRNEYCRRCRRHLRGEYYASRRTGFIQPEVEATAIEEEKTLWKNGSAFGNATLLPTGTTSKCGVNILFFCIKVKFPGVTIGVSAAAEAVARLLRDGYSLSCARLQDEPAQSCNHGGLLFRGRRGLRAEARYATGQEQQ